MRTNLHHLLEQRAASHGQAPALTFKETTLNYADLSQQAHEVAEWLARAGVDREQRVAIYLEKRIETVAAIFGTSAAGGVFVPINPLLRQHQVAHILSDCEARVLVTSPDRFELLREILDACPTVMHVLLVETGTAGANGLQIGRIEIHNW